MTETKKNKTGFASMKPERVKQIASQGGKAISKNRVYMSELGRKGGAKVGANKEHMARIGRLGGLKVHGKKEGGE